MFEILELNKKFYEDEHKNRATILNEIIDKEPKLISASSQNNFAFNRHTNIFRTYPPPKPPPPDGAP